MVRLQPVLEQSHDELERAIALDLDRRARQRMRIAEMEEMGERLAKEARKQVLASRAGRPKPT
eukprot:8598499-Lingulodinium_polyedra.AAC.1